MRVNLNQCKDAVRKELAVTDFFSEEEVESIVTAIDNKMKNIDKSNLVDVEAKIAELAEDFTQEAKKIAAIEKRNALLAIKASRRIKKHANTYATGAEGLLAFLEDSRKSIEGAGKGVNATIEGWKSKYIGELKARLMKNNVFDIFKSDKLEKEIFMEFYEPGSSGNKQAMKIREIMVSLKQDMVERQNLHGGAIHFLPEHVKRQSYNVSLIKKQFGPSRFKSNPQFKHLTPEEYVRTFNEWKDFIKPMLDPETTFKDSDPDKFLRGVFDGIMSGRHGPLEKVSGAELNTKFYKTGSLSRRISTQRILHYKDGASAYAAHKAFSSEPLSAGFISELDHGATNIALMEMMGPSPEATLTEVINELEYGYSRDGKEKQLRELQKNRMKIMTALKFLNHEAKIPENPNMHTAVGAIASVLSQAKLGKLLFFALPDKAFLQSTLTRNGLNGVEAMTEALRITRPKNAKERLRLIELGAEAKSFINTVNSRFTTGAEAYVPSALNTSQKHFFNFTGINYIDDMGTTAIMHAIPRKLGALAGMKFDQLPPANKHMLSQFGITELEWDAIRSTAYSVDSKANVVEWKASTDSWITPDRFPDIETKRIEALLKSKDIPISENNIKREVSELESKYRSYLTSQRDEGVLMPGSKEHRLAAFGTQAGTGIGSLTRLMMMFKSFPITVFTKIMKREVQGRNATTFKQWLKAEKNSNFHTVQLVAMLTVAGYISLTIDDLIAGKERRKFFDEKGNLDKHALKTLQASFLRGGAGGLYADLLLREYDNSYNTAARALGGPVLSEFERGVDILSDTVRGEFDGAKAGKFIKGNTPWLNMFYIKPALDYLLFYNLQEFFDEGSLKKMERHQRQEYGTEYWLSPSETSDKILTQLNLD